MIRFHFRVLVLILIMLVAAPAAIAHAASRPVAPALAHAESSSRAPALSPAAPTPPRSKPSGTFYDSINPGLVGGLLGAGVGIWGGLIGTIGGVCAPRGKAKSLMISLFAIQIAAGLILIALGIGAFMVGAPWMSGYVFLLPGGLAALLGVMLFPVILARYRQAELRRIDAEAFRAG